MKIPTRGGFVILLFIAACSQEHKSNQKYFDFDRLIDDQISEMNQRKRVLDKTADMEGIQSDTTFLPSGKGWESELEIFRELEKINKPAYRNTYLVTDPVKDTRSNLLIRRYAAPSEPVSIVEFYYQSEISHLKKIEASITEKNILYTTHRILKMEFEEGEDGRPLLIRYSLNGFQKMFLQDTVRLSMQGQIDW